MSKTNIGIVGMGYVGGAMYDFFKNHYNVITYDVKDNEADFNLINLCDFIFICVPTPERKDGSCDTSIVEESINKITRPEAIVVIKSTVPPGTCESLSKKTLNNIVFSPEFSGQNTYYSPYKFLSSVIESPFFIFGGNNGFVTQKVIDLYQKIGGPDKKYISTTFKEAEMLKYVNNSFFALKVAFCNELYNLCLAAGVNYGSLRELWNLDPRNNPSFTSVFSNERGYGGKCFLKDVEAFVKFSEDNNSFLSILDSARRSNISVRKNANASQK